MSVTPPSHKRQLSSSSKEEVRDTPPAKEKTGSVAQPIFTSKSKQGPHARKLSFSNFSANPFTPSKHKRYQSQPDFLELRKCPPAPTRPTSKNTTQSKWVKSILDTRKIIEERLYDAQSFEILNKKIEGIRHLSSEGDYCDVYLCDVEGEGQWVLKILKPERFKNQREVVDIFANQLLRYAQNRKHLKEHVAQHANFDLYLAEVQSYTHFSQFREYIEKKENVHGFLFVRYVPEEFPQNFDENNSYWQQLKKLFKDSSEHGISNDLKHPNIGIKEGKVTIFDLHEQDGDEVDAFSLLLPTLLESFTKDPKEQAWLRPSLS